MLSKKNIVLTALAALAAVALILTQTAWSDSQKQAIKLEGAWVATVPGTPLQWNAVLVPDSSGRRAAIYGSLQVRVPADLMDPDVPATDHSSDYVGEVIMTGPNTAKVTTVGHGIKKVAASAQYPFWEKIEFVWECSGVFKFTDAGKIDFTFNLSDYSPGPDGLPDYTKPLGFSMDGAAKVVRVGFK